MYSFNVTIDNAVEVLKDGAVVDTVGPWETKAEAGAWGKAITEKYNAPEYVDTPYPEEIEVTK